MGKKLLGMDAVEVMGFYAAGFLNDYRSLLQNPDTAHNIDTILDTYEATNKAYLDRLITIGSFDRELLDVTNLKALTQALQACSKCLSYINTTVEYKDRWFDGGEDAGFYLGQISFTANAFLELLDELDPMGEYTREYIIVFVQGFC